MPNGPSVLSKVGSGHISSENRDCIYIYSSSLQMSWKFHTLSSICLTTLIQPVPVYPTLLIWKTLNILPRAGLRGKPASQTTAWGTKTSLE
jgi:hypothetical protein